MMAPDVRQQGKADPKRCEPTHGFDQLTKVLWHFKRHHEQRNHESKHGVREAPEPCDLRPPSTENLFPPGSLPPTLLVSLLPRYKILCGMQDT